MRKKLIAFIVILSMITTLAGCKKTNNQTEDLVEATQKSNTEDTDKGPQKGCYVENMIPSLELELYERNIGFDISTENQLEYYTMLSTRNYLNSIYSCYTLVDGSYQKTSVDWINKAASEFSFDAIQYCHGEDGMDYFLYKKPYTLDTKGKPEIDKIECGVLQKVKNTNDYVDITPADWESGLNISELQVTKDGVLCYKEDYINLLFYNPVKKEGVDYGNFTDVGDYVIQGDTLYYIDKIKNEIQIVQLGRNQIEKIALGSIVRPSHLQVSSIGDIFILNEGGIHKYKNGGTIWETVVDGYNTNMSSPDFMSMNFVIVPGTLDTYYVLYLNWLESNKLVPVAYQYDENASYLPMRELTIYTMWNSQSLDQAIYSYSQLHKDVKINLVEWTSLDDIMGPNCSTIMSDAIRSINTEILSGSGPDIILMDGMPMSSYIEKGVLMDISDCFSDLQKENNLAMNIANNYLQDGKIYCMPMRFFMPICFMNEDITEHTESIEDLAAYCQSSEKNLMAPLNYKILALMFLCTYGNEIFTGDGTCSQENISSFLSSINQIAKTTGATEDRDLGQAYITLPSSDSTRWIRRSLNGNLGYENEDVACAISFIGDYPDLSRVCTFEKLVDGKYIPLNDLFIPDGTVGINNNTKDTKLAKDFVKYLFSEDIQTKHIDDGFPVNSKALTAWSQETYSQDCLLIEAFTRDGERELIQIESATSKDKQKVIEEVRALTKPVVLDIACWDMLLNTTMEYLKGEKTLEQASDELYQKVDLYLSE